jgi:hypothetical protein
MQAALGPAIGQMPASCAPNPAFAPKSLYDVNVVKAIVEAE